MELLAETYVVLDVPNPFAGCVLDLRLQARDDFRAARPLEITRIGSGGAGPILPHHARLRAAGLDCRPSAWPFVPHCTIRSRGPVREDEAEAVLREVRPLGQTLTDPRDR